MKTLIFGQMVVQREKINERRPYIFVEWSFANGDPSFWWNGRSLKKE